MDDASCTEALTSPHHINSTMPLYGNSPPMQALSKAITRIAPTDVTVFLQGESGTGKELIAQTIHDHSLRRDEVYLPVNCGAFSASLIESELFGHERGAFTGATRQHRGCFERADKGTLFLDEVTEMQPDLQVKLLRVLETGKLMRVGGQTPITVDVRVIAATNRPLAEAVADGSLRNDLYFRLATFPIRVPRLRERPGDVELLARRFLDSLNAADGITKSLSDEAMDALRRYAWPGNVRELKNLMQRAYIMADERIEVEHFPPLHATVEAAEGDESFNVCVGASLDEVERRLIMATLHHYEGDKRRTAATLGVSLKTIYNRLQRYEVRARRMAQHSSRAIG